GFEGPEERLGVGARRTAGAGTAAGAAGIHGRARPEVPGRLRDAPRRSERGQQHERGLVAHRELRGACIGPTRRRPHPGENARETWIASDPWLGIYPAGPDRSLGRPTHAPGGGVALGARRLARKPRRAPGEGVAAAPQIGPARILRSGALAAWVE